MLYQKDIINVGWMIPFALGVLHLALQAGGTSVLGLPELYPNTSLRPFLPNNQDRIPQQSDNSNIIVNKTTIENWDGFDVQADDHDQRNVTGLNLEQDEKQVDMTPKQTSFMDYIKYPMAPTRKDVSGKPVKKADDYDDEDRAAELGLSTKTFRTIRDLLKETKGIDLGTKPQNITESSNDRDNEEFILERERRVIKCPESPPGLEQCIPCPDDYERQDSFWHTDENGNTCKCDICMRPTYMSEPCTCTSDGNVAPGGGPTCAYPVKGETYMPYHNWCSQPFSCRTTCPGDLVISKNLPCTVDEDAVCECPENFDQTGETSCAPIPRCQENYESRRDIEPGANAEYPVHVCKPCEDGYVQPHNNSLNKCYLHLNTEKPDTTGDLPADERTSTSNIGISPSPESNYSTTTQESNHTKGNWCICENQEKSTPGQDGVSFPQITTPPHVPVANFCMDPIFLVAVGVFLFIFGLAAGVLVSPVLRKKSEKQIHHRPTQRPANNSSSDGEEAIPLRQLPDQNQGRGRSRGRGARGTNSPRSHRGRGTRH